MIVTRLSLSLIGALLIGALPLPAASAANDAMPAANAVTTAESIVLKDLDALSTGDAEALVAVFAPEFEMHGLPADARALVGPRSDKLRNREQLRSHFKQAFSTQPLARHEAVGMVSLGDLVVARVAIHTAGKTPPDHALVAFRVRHGLIDAIWHIAVEPGAGPDSGAAGQAVIRRFADAADRGDVETFLGLFSPDARNYHFRRDPQTLGGGPSQSLTDQASRERTFRTMFAGPRVRIAIVESLALGEWVVSRDQATRSDGTVLDELSLYRVRDGRITDDWYVAEQARQ